jgi:hypothetical protein
LGSGIKPINPFAEGADKVAKMLKMRRARAPEECVQQLGKTRGGDIPGMFYFPTVYFNLP